MSEAPQFPFLKTIREKTYDVRPFVFEFNFIYALLWYRVMNRLQLFTQVDQRRILYITYETV
jgi:hypothetical protein